MGISWSPLRGVKARDSLSSPSYLVRNPILAPHLEKMHVVLHPVQVENGDHAGPIRLTRVVGLEAAGARTQQSCGEFGSGH